MAPWTSGLILKTVQNRTAVVHSGSAQWLPLLWATLRMTQCPLNPLWCPWQYVTRQPPFVSRTFQKGTERAKGQAGQIRTRSRTRVFSMPPWPALDGESGSAFPDYNLTTEWHFPYFPNASTVCSWLLPTVLLRSGILSYWQETGTKAQRHQTHLKWEGSIPNVSSLIGWEAGLGTPFQRTRGSLGLNRRAITAARSNSESPRRRGTQKEQRV